MTPVRYLLRSVLHYRFAYLGVLAAAVLGAAVLLGALFAGDSVAESLRRIATLRIGRATHALPAGDRFFREALAGDLSAAAGVRATPLLLARGTVTSGADGTAIGQVQLAGVTEGFWQLAPKPAVVSLAAASSSVAINRPLAQRLRLSVGDTLVVRLQRPGILGASAPVAGAESRLESLRCRVAAIVEDESFGRFGLEATQVAGPTVFLPLAMLQSAFDRPGRANLMLIEAGARGSDLAGIVADVMQLADYGLQQTWLESAGVFEITSDRILIPPEIAEAVQRALPAAQPVTTYLVNEFRTGDRATPYSLATATTAAAAPFLPADLGPREIVLNRWLADDLAASPGDEVRLAYYQVGAGDALVERFATFRVRSIVPLEGLAASNDWMPEFPGMAAAEDQSDWDPGLPLNLARLRDKDERYWDSFRGAPKAFLSEAGGEIWATRWGRLTALRIPAARDAGKEITANLLSALQPQPSGMQLRELRAGADRAAVSTVDFGGLFAGMSLFLIVAALGLVAMLFQLSLGQRRQEDALLGAVGVDPRRVLRWRLAESLAVLLAGLALGLPLAAAYTRGILRFLGTIWAGPGAATGFVFAASPASLVAGGLGFLGLSLLAVWLVLRGGSRRAVSIRLAAGAEETAPRAGVRRSSLIVAGVAGGMGVAAVSATGFGLPAQAAFYLAGFSLLAAGMGLCRARLAREPEAGDGTRLGPAYLGRLNLRARRGRNLTVVGLIAAAVFMVLSVASFRKHVGGGWQERGSGMGGFAFRVETTAPQTPARDGGHAGFEIFAREAAALGAIVPLRIGAGENASCFNLNATSQPQLLAVDSAEFARLGAFRPRPVGWEALRSVAGDGTIPALVDATTLQWALKRKVGDVLSYTDERGREFGVRIVGTIPDSIFQGHLLVDEPAFLERFPSNAGYSVFLVDARTPGDLEALRGRLAAAVADAGGRVDLTRDVLAAFHEVENTYIAIFNVLGSLGVILGSLGLVIVVARSLRERRGEFAVLLAIGLPRRVLARMVLAEYGWLVAWGVGIGLAASAIAVGPNLAALPAAPTLAILAALLAGMALLNLAGGWLIFRWSVRDLRPALGEA